MRTGKDIDFTRVDFITYAVGEYWNDIPIYDVVSKYVRLYQTNENTYSGEYEDGNDSHNVVVYRNKNICTVDSEVVNPEEFIALFEGEGVNPVPIIKKLTGVDLDEYISDVTYNDGTTELLDVKGKVLLVGEWKKVTNNKQQ